MPKVNLMRVFGVICAAALVLVTAVSYISWQVNDIEDSVLRLHIVANSDSDEDLRLGMKWWTDADFCLKTVFPRNSQSKPPLII